jgi:CP family cyanate transporter-like MFS transporter
VPVAALLLYAVVLRTPLVVVSPLLPDIRADFGLNAAQAGLFTSVPVLCFGLLTPVASGLLRLVGINHAALYGLAGIIIGSVVRSTGGLGGAFAGTVIIGAAIAIGNLAVPMLIGRQFRDRAALLTAAYSATTNVGVAAATALAAPMALWGDWRWSAAVGGVGFGSLALAVWLWVYPPGVRGARASIQHRAGLDAPVGRVHAKDAIKVDRSPLLRWRVTWLLATAFCGHTFAYYVITAWLPTMLIETQEMSIPGAGFASSLFQAGGILGPVAVAVTVGALRWPVLRIVTCVCATWLLMPIGMLAAPVAWPVWSLIAGVGQGAFFTALFMIIIQRARDVDENRRLTAVVQTAGYCVAATGPAAMGWLNEISGSWNLVLGAVATALMIMTVASMSTVLNTSEPP